MGKKYNEWFEILTITNKTSKFTTESYKQWVLSTLSEEILSEIEKQKLLVSCIVKYNQKEDVEEKKEIFFNENDIAVIYRQLKLISSRMQIFDEAVESTLQKIKRYTKHDTELIRDNLTEQQIKDGL